MILPRDGRVCPFTPTTCVQVYKHLDKLCVSGGPNIKGLCVRELERAATTYELPKELCRAYANDRETRRQLEMLRRTMTGGVTIPRHRVAFGLFQNSPRDGEHLEFFVQATVRPLPRQPPPVAPLCIAKCLPPCVHVEHTRALSQTPVGLYL